jgi:hypothetical protein
VRLTGTIIVLFLASSLLYASAAETQQYKQYRVPEGSADSTSELEKLQYPWIGIVTKVTGKTIINRFDTGGENRIAAFTAEKGMVVHERDELTTGEDSIVTIRLKNDTVMNLAPNTVFKVYRHYTDQKNNQSSSFNLLLGGVRASLEKLLPGSWFKLYTNNATIGVRGTEFVADYSADEKATKVACFRGEVEVTPSITGGTGSEATAFANPVQVKSGESVRVETLRDEKGFTPYIAEKKSLSDKVENSIKNTFTNEKVKMSDWDFARISGSFWRFNLGYELITGGFLEAQKKSAFQISWVPLFEVYSFIYLEPFFSVGIIKFDTFYLKLGGNFIFNVWRGLNLGIGGGIAGGVSRIAGPDTETDTDTDIETETETVTEAIYSGTGYSGYFTIMDFSANYTFLNKKLGFIDGVSVIFSHGSGNDTYPSLNSLQLALILNFSNGREKW